MTLHEMRVLRAGFAITQQIREDDAKGVDPEDRARFNEFKKKLDADDDPTTA